MLAFTRKQNSRMVIFLKIYIILEPRSKKFTQYLFLSAAADREIGSFTVRQNPNTRACSLAQQTAVRGLTGGGLVTGFYWNSWVICLTWKSKSFSVINLHLLPTLMSSRALKHSSQSLGRDSSMSSTDRPLRRSLRAMQLKIKTTMRTF